MRWCTFHCDDRLAQQQIYYAGIATLQCKNWKNKYMTHQGKMCLIISYIWVYWFGMTKKWHTFTESWILTRLSAHFICIYCSFGVQNALNTGHILDIAVDSFGLSNVFAHRWVSFQHSIRTLHFYFGFIKVSILKCFSFFLFAKCQLWVARLCEVPFDAIINCFLFFVLFSFSLFSKNFVAYKNHYVFVMWLKSKSSIYVFIWSIYF